ncbi:pirin family protein [Sphingobium phenoxybenzoativorans]|uniref:pirin family protein n=1 Tax=Sphingobium phenoxybenzoativorans TaxID=1592790 RepID=UPI0008720FAE|nr:pirin-like C-terminal cupin domain-containing protein [Sphingobium phenoxybenzoativorans]
MTAISESKTLVRRSIVRIDRPAMGPGYNPYHRARPLIPGGDWQRTDPFLLLMEDVVTGGGDFSPHPHRGLETVTFMREGALEEIDNLSHISRLKAGDVQFVAAGRGIVHCGRPQSADGFHLYQLWVNMPAADKLSKARVVDIDMADAPVRHDPGVEARVYAGTSGAATAPYRTRTPVTVVDFQLQPHASAEQIVPQDWNAFVVVAEGDGRVGADEAAISEGQIGWTGWVESESLLTLVAGDRGMRVLFYAGLPIREPVYARGPFVMNELAEIEAAFAEYRRTGERFGLDPT